MNNKEAAFWDASALVPLCVIESTTPTTVKLMREMSPVVWWGSIVEIQSAICRLHRDLTIPDAGKRTAAARLEELNRTWKEISPGEKLRELALTLLCDYSLKAADGLQLAAALIWCEEKPARRKFVCADQKLLKIARSVGFAVVELP
jgi:predicted nucleic acid-binding protein